MRTILRWMLVLASLGAVQAQDKYDVLLRGGHVVDGTRTPARRADVAIRGDRIAAIGDLQGADASQIVDAQGLIVAPGFIDGHAHADNIDRLPDAPNFLAMGVTTIVSGNCGYSNKDVRRHLQRLEKVGCSLNYATLIGHGTIRTAAMGRANRAPTEAELAKMRALLREALEAGAVGMSTGLIYVPGTYAETDELVALSEVLAEFGALYASHMRNENVRVLQAIDEAISISKRTGVALHLSHLKSSGKRNWGGATAITERLRDARAAGVPVTGDQYAYDAASTSIDVLFPNEALSIGRTAFARKLDSDAAFAEEMFAALHDTIEHAGFGDLSYCRIAHAPGNSKLDGLRLPEAAQRHLGNGDADHQARLAIELFADAKGKRVSMIYHSMSEADVELLMREPYIAVACDAGIVTAKGAGKPHPRGSGNNPRVLGEFVRKRAVLDLPLAVHKMTALPAEVFGLADRGVLRPGARADVVLFDPQTVRDGATFAEPRLRPTGIPYVLVNGVFVIDNGEHTGARPGKVLRHPRPEAGK